MDTHKKKKGVIEITELTDTESRVAKIVVSYNEETYSYSIENFSKNCVYDREGFLERMVKDFIVNKVEEGDLKI